MSGSSTETLTAALRRLADEHASGLLSVAAPGRDVVFELADGVPVGIGPTHDVSDRVGRDAGSSMVAAAVVDELVDRTVAAIVGGDGDWTWDVTSDADMMPVPVGLATELSRRAVDAAQALAKLDPELALQPGRDLETTGEVARVRALFDGERSIEDVAEQAGMTVPAVATIAAALVRAGVLSTGMDDSEPPSWTDTVAGSTAEEEEDEPELWVMDEPEELDVPEDTDGDGADDVAAASPEPEASPPEPGAPVRLRRDDQPPVRQRPATTAGTTPEDDITEAMEWVAGEEPEPAASASSAGSATSDDDEGWDDTTWLDELDSASRGPSQDAPPVVEAGGADPAHGEPQQDARSALSSMISELQGSGGGQVEPRQQPPPAEPTRTDSEDDDEEPARATDATRREPKAEPGEVAEFLRELSRLALDDD